MAAFGGQKGTLLYQYLGLPLGVRKPKRIEMQPLIDKIAGKLAPRKGRLLNRMGRLIYTNSVVTATATFFLTAFQPDKWLIKKVDKLRKNFLWEADSTSIGGKSMVNWKQACSPKKYGGLGIKNIECFSRALRLRWEWYRWEERDRPWKGTDTPCDGVDKQLFSSCTTISLGDGSLASFWRDRWLNGEAPMVLAPAVFKLACFKKVLVKQGMHNAKWMQGLNRISNAEELRQFVQRWNKVQGTTLSTEKDTILLNLTANGSYSACSAYEAQFFSRIERPRLARVWTSKMEGKVKFYLWLLLQNRNWTADRLQARGGPHNERCKLCDQEPETANHIALLYSFAKEVWFQFRDSHNAMFAVADEAQTVGEWWERLCSAGGSKEQNRLNMTVAAYTVWNLWKERNQRVFDHKALQESAILQLIKQDILQPALSIHWLSDVENSPEREPDCCIFFIFFWWGDT